MKKKTLVKHFGGVAQTAKTFGCTRQAVYKWRDPLPLLRQYQANEYSGGELKIT